MTGHKPPCQCGSDAANCEWYDTSPRRDGTHKTYMCHVCAVGFYLGRADKAEAALRIMRRLESETDK